jgi:hypothetical protein
MGWLMWLLTVLLYASLAVIATRGIGIALGIVSYSLTVVVFVAIAGLALKGSTVGSITWRNRLAGWLLPWTKWVGGGQLHSLLIKNATVSILFGWLMIWCDQNGLLHELVGLTASDNSRRISWIQLAVLWTTVGCWLILALAWLLLMRSWFKSQLNVLSVLLKGRDNGLPFLLPPASVTASIALRYAELPALALAVVAIPLLITTGPVLLMMAVFLWHHLRGKPIRWN